MKYGLRLGSSKVGLETSESWYMVCPRVLPVQVGSQGTISIRFYFLAVRLQAQVGFGVSAQEHFVTFSP